MFKAQMAYLTMAKRSGAKCANGVLCTQRSSEELKRAQRAKGGTLRERKWALKGPKGSFEELTTLEQINSGS